ncbi:MAG: aminotransferase class V-fold PLP-dependent enzyme, partial [Gemmatimonadota bacterium]
SATYVRIDMHPPDPLEELDAIFFSPHKFLGGPGASGVLIFDSRLYHNAVPDQPGGGTVDWTNPWGGRRYIPDIEEREDGGTPGFLQTIKAALCVQLKERMGVENILAREEELLSLAFAGLRRIPRLHVLAGHIEERLAIISFYVEGLHYNLIVKLLNDRFGIQSRGGCSCAGTYGHYLLHVDPERSRHITDMIDHGDLSEKPGWVRMSFHPTTSDEEVQYVVDAIAKIAVSHGEWSKAYRYSPQSNEFQPKDDDGWGPAELEAWFDL